MVRLRYCALILCLVSLPLTSQENNPAGDTAGMQGKDAGGVVPAAVQTAPPLSRLAFGAGIGVMGINLQVATNVNRYANVRVSGNVFSYTVNNISSNGFNASGKLNMASIDVSLDYFPWPNHGFRLSPGVLVYNENALTASATVDGGRSFTLNGVDYYSSSSDPVHANAELGLNANKPAFSMTTGWGNMIKRNGGHWAFPVEVGAAFVGSPSFNMTLTGTACDSSGLNCVNAATDPGIQNNLKAQIDKYKNDVNVLSVYPILSFGVSYNFKTR